MSVRQGDTWNKVYVSPEDASFTLQEIPQNKKGTYTAYSTETTDWAGKLVLNYRLPLNDAGTTVLSWRGYGHREGQVFFDAGEGGRVYEGQDDGY